MSITDKAIAPENPGLRKLKTNGDELSPHENAEPSFSASQARLVRLEQTANGMWVVRSQSNLRGGLFRDYRSAAYFIKHNFNPSLVIVNGGREKH